MAVFRRTQTVPALARRIRRTAVKPFQSAKRAPVITALIAERMNKKPLFILKNRNQYGMIILLHKLNTMKTICFWVRFFAYGKNATSILASITYGFQSKVCVATSGVMRFSVCGFVWGYTLFIFQKMRGENNSKKERAYGNAGKS